MTSTSSKKRSKKLQTFSGDYTKKWSCIVPSKRNTNSACCTLCSSDFGIGHGGSNDIQVHLKSVKHRTAAAEASSNSRSHDIAQFFVAKDNSVTNAEVKFTQFLIEHNIAFSAADHLSQLVKNAFPDSKIASKYACRRSKATAIARTLGQETKEVGSSGKASAKQRQGRAGRVREGFCFRLYTKHRYEALRSFTQPEIQRVALEELCLHIMKCSLGNPEDFLQEALDPPLPQAVRASMSLLREVGACLAEVPTLTPLGQHLAALPVNVRIGKMLLFAAIFGCLEPVAVIASAMTDKPPFLVPLGKRSQADAAKRAMAIANSDHITIYKAYSGWKEAQSKGRSAESKFCHGNFLSRTALLNMQNVKKDLIHLVKSIGFIPSSTNHNTSHTSAANKKSLSSKMEVLDISKTESPSGYKDIFPLTASNTALLKSVLTAGLYPNVAKTSYEPPAHGMKDDDIVCRADTTKGPVTVHPSSVNHRLGANGWMLFSERVKLSRVYIRESSLITPYPLLLFGGEIAVHHRESLISVDDWIKFQASAKTAVIFKELRLLLNVFLEKKLANPALQIQDEEVIKALLKLLKSEKAR